jgi:hypothetical protein
VLGLSYLILTGGVGVLIGFLLLRDEARRQAEEVQRKEEEAQRQAKEEAQREEEKKKATKRVKKNSSEGPTTPKRKGGTQAAPADSEQPSVNTDTPEADRKPPEPKALP